MPRKAPPPPNWPQPGTLVWYHPSKGLALRFAGTVFNSPYLLGGHTWVVDLDMPTEYTTWHPTKRTRVSGAACDCLTRREEAPMTDNEPVIHLKLPLSAGMLVALENLAALVMNDEVPFLEAEARTVAAEGSSPANKERVGELKQLSAAYRAFHAAVGQAIVLPPVDNAADHVVGEKT